MALHHAIVRTAYRTGIADDVLDSDELRAVISELRASDDYVLFHGAVDAKTGMLELLLMTPLQFKNLVVDYHQRIANLARSNDEARRAAIPKEEVA